MENRNSRINDIFPILLFLVFTLSALGIVMVSVQIYQKILKQSEESYDMEIAVAYVTEKFRSHDSLGSIDVTEFAGNDALILTDQVLDETYITLIYTHGGYLRELYVEKSLLDSCNGDSGTAILEMDGFEVKKPSDSLFHLVFRDKSGGSMETSLSVMSKAVMSKEVAADEV